MKLARLALISPGNCQGIKNHRLLFRKGEQYITKYCVAIKKENKISTIDVQKHYTSFGYVCGISNK